MQTLKAQTGYFLLTALQAVPASFFWPLWPQCPHSLTPLPVTMPWKGISEAAPVKWPQDEDRTDDSTQRAASSSQLSHL